MCLIVLLLSQCWKWKEQLSQILAVYLSSSSIIVSIFLRHFILGRSDGPVDRTLVGWYLTQIGVIIMMTVDQYIHDYYSRWVPKMRCFTKAYFISLWKEVTKISSKSSWALQHGRSSHKLIFCQYFWISWSHLNLSHVVAWNISFIISW